MTTRNDVRRVDVEPTGGVKDVNSVVARRISDRGEVDGLEVLGGRGYGPGARDLAVGHPSRRVACPAAHVAWPRLCLHRSEKRC